MLKISTNLFQKTRASTSTGEGAEEAWQRGGSLKQLGINYRWSPIVRDERTPYVHPADTQPIDVYGAEGGGACILRAGDRAPDAPGLVDSRQPDAEPTKLFRIFGVTYHTVLVFSSDATQTRAVLDAVKEYPSDRMKTVAIHPQGTSTNPTSVNADYIVTDRDGHAYNGYNVTDSATTTIVIVRPDGVVGGIVFGVEGLQKFFQAYH